MYTYGVAANWCLS